MSRTAIKQYAAARDIQLKDLAKKTGISVHTVYYMSHGNPKSIKFDDIKKLCDQLRITPNELLNYSVEGWKE